MIDDLIYDVGMHDGRDTRYYLSKGFRVLAIEANPALATAARSSFANEIEAGRLTVISTAIGANCDRVNFWVNDDNTEHSSLEPTVGARNNSRHHVIEVESVSFDNVLRDFGVPFYLKIDIETADPLCLAALKPPDLPMYVSIEAHALRYLTELGSLGYSAFKVIDQRTYTAPIMRTSSPGNTVPRELVRRARFRAASVPMMRHAYRKLRPRGNRSRQPEWGPSGPFGEDTYGEWQDLEEAAYAWLTTRRLAVQDTWFDFHARRGACCSPDDPGAEIRSIVDGGG